MSTIYDLLDEYFNKNKSIDIFNDIDNELLFLYYKNYCDELFINVLNINHIEMLEYINTDKAIDMLKYKLVHNLCFINIKYMIELYMKYNMNLNTLLFNDNLYFNDDNDIYNFIIDYKINVNYIYDVNNSNSEYIDIIDYLTYYIVYDIMSKHVNLIKNLIELGYDYNKNNNLLLLLTLDPSYFMTLKINDFTQFLYNINYEYYDMGIGLDNIIININYILSYNLDIDINKLKLSKYTNIKIIDIFIDKYTDKFTFSYMINKSFKIDLILRYVDMYNIKIENIKLPILYYNSITKKNIINLIENGYDINNLYDNDNNVCGPISYFEVLIEHNMIFDCKCSVITNLDNSVIESLDILSKCLHKNDLLDLYNNTILYYNSYHVKSLLNDLINKATS